VHANFIGVLLNIFEAVDVITIIKGGNYEELNLEVGQALLKRGDVGTLEQWTQLT
jgi:5'-AMP-activated protein kinase, regulatory gamma subunit